MIAHELIAGTELRPLHIEPISRKTLALFAGASGDHQPTHIDIDAARAKGRDDVIAHGMLMMAYLGRMLTDLVPQDKIRSFKARFVAITPVHANRIIRQLRDDGIVDISRGRVAVLDEAKLAELAQFDDRYLHQDPSL